MATKKKEPSTAVANWNEELAKFAGKAKAAAKTTSGGKFFSSQAGVLQYDGVPLPGNQMAVVVLDFIQENVYYGRDFDPEDKSPPACFAFSQNSEGEVIEEDDMEPHEITRKEDVFEPQSDQCRDCRMNEWGSAEKGKGKACGNRRRLAMIPAGIYETLGKGKGFELNMFDEEDSFKKADIAYAKIPVMSVKHWNKYVNQLADEMGRPPFGVFTRVWLEPDTKSQFKWQFELLEEVPDDLIPVMLARHKEASKEIAFPYTPFTEEEAKPAPRNQKLARGAKKPAPKKTAGRR